MPRKDAASMAGCPRKLQALLEVRELTPNVAGGGTRATPATQMRMTNAHSFDDMMRIRPDGGSVPRRSNSSPKRATNVSVRSDLLAAAREAGVNLSAALESALIERLAQLRREKWRRDNHDSIAAYNEHIEKHGTFSDDVRSF